MSATPTVDAGRAAFAKGDWSEACAHLTAADAQSPIDPADLDSLATALFLTGHDHASMQARTRAHAGFLERGEPIRAARSAFWLAFVTLERPSQQAQAAGWLARAQRLIDEVNQPCVEQGWLLCAAARQRVAAGDPTGALDAFTQAADVGVRFGDRDLIHLARHGRGRVLLFMNQAAEGLALLDEVMVAVTAGEVAPLVAGAVYCSVITACHDLFDLRRAQEWTTALAGWCASQPSLVPFRGYCLIRRSELMQLHGAWDEAFAEARRACDRLSDRPSEIEAGAAYYQIAELHRLRGELDAADEAYRLASSAGRKPQPGLALLRLCQGRIDTADAAIRLALRETRPGRSRVTMLCASVEIMLAANDVNAAREAVDELTRIAQHLDLPYLRAVSLQTRGALALHEGRAIDALDCLRSACLAWQEVDAPYEHSQVRVLTGQAYRQLGDREGARLELEAAHETFERLGAAPAVSAAAALLAECSGSEAAGSGLTGREIEVLRLIATGVTNRVIADRLDISEKTVARHVSNIFTKLDLPSRSAATAYAYEHKLV